LRIYLDCVPCFFQQALRAARIAGAGEREIMRLFVELGKSLEGIPLRSNPAEMGRLIYGKVREITGNRDPYEAVKEESTRKALELYPYLKKKVEESPDRLMTAIRIAVAGNVIDFGVNRRFNVLEELEAGLTRDFVVCHYDEFKRLLDRADRVLYIGDNAGESVFDRVLIEELGKPVTYVVREVPVINDVTYRDAVRAGIDKVASIVSSGTDAPGTVLETCNPEFRELFENSSFIVSKGQGNYEALSDQKQAIFFLLKAKCWVIAGDIGVKEGDIILKGINTGL